MVTPELRSQTECGFLCFLAVKSGEPVVEIANKPRMFRIYRQKRFDFCCSPKPVAALRHRFRADSIPLLVSLDLISNLVKTPDLPVVTMVVRKGKIRCHKRG